MRIKKIMAVALAAVMVVGTAGISTPVKATGTENSSTYTVTIPAELKVKNVGWNATDGIKAKGTLENGKKLSITATSKNGDWKLKANGVTDTVDYKLAKASGDTDATTTWEFATLSDSDTTQTMGIIVEDYSSKAPGNYTDTVTFTAKVESAMVAVTGITLNKTKLLLDAGSSETLTATVSPADATDKTVTWESSNSNITVSNGTVTVAAGTARGTEATITAKAGDKTATCTVRVPYKLPDVFSDNANVVVQAVAGNSTLSYYATGTFDSSTTSYKNVKASNSMNFGPLNGDITMTKDGSKLTVVMKNNYNAGITFVIDTSTKTYTTSKISGGGSPQNAHDHLGSIKVNGDDVTSELTAN